MGTHPPPQSLFTTCNDQDAGIEPTVDAGANHTEASTTDPGRDTSPAASELDAAVDANANSSLAFVLGGCNVGAGSSHGSLVTIVLLLCAGYVRVRRRRRQDR